MNGCARITKSDEAIYVRFEGIGNRQRFNIVMDKFNKTFQLKNWDGARRSWELVPADLDAIISFCSVVFGKRGYIISQDNTIDTESQLPFSM